ncbi:MAG: hypothetical protein LBR22_03825 [Desulfovibrio sp.]|nr:hypothetical protein [Desulfovibrio sp.]
MTDAASLAAWLETVLRHGLGRLDLPALLRCVAAASARDADALRHWDRIVLAGRESAELWEEEVRMGRALCRLLREQGRMPDWMGGKDCGYVAGFALGAIALGVGPDRAVATGCAYGWSWLENQVAAATRCLGIGQRAAQGVLLSLAPVVEEVVLAAMDLDDEDVGASLPGLTMASIGHESQYSRLFRS